MCLCASAISFVFRAREDDVVKYLDSRIVLCLCRSLCRLAVATFPNMAMACHVAFCPAAIKPYHNCKHAHVHCHFDCHFAYTLATIRNRRQWVANLPHKANKLPQPTDSDNQDERRPKDSCSREEVEVQQCQQHSNKTVNAQNQLPRKRSEERMITKVEDVVRR